MIKIDMITGWLHSQLLTIQDLEELACEVMQITIDRQAVSKTPHILKEEDMCDLKHMIKILGFRHIVLDTPDDLWDLSRGFLGHFFIPRGIGDMPFTPRVTKGSRRAKRRAAKQKARQRLADICKADSLKQIAVKDRGNGVYHINKGHGADKALMKKRTSKVVRKMDGKIPNGRFVHKTVPMSRMS